MVTALHDPVEEFVNSVSHGIGFASMLTAVIWVVGADTSAAAVSGRLIFVITAALVFLASTLYHACPPGRIKTLLLKFDYAAIFVFIAGSYTAFALASAAAAPDWILLALVWGLAIVGLLLSLYERLSKAYATTYYLTFGWLTLAAALPMTLRMPRAAVVWLLLGGAIYSAGVIFYCFGGRLRFSHLGWHVLVMLGSACHLVALLRI